MSNLTSSLTIRLLDQVSGPAKTVAGALKDAEKKVKDIASAMKGTGATDKFVSNLAKLKLSAKDIEAVSKAWKDYAKAQGLAANSALWTKDQVAGVKRWESQTIGALRSVKREQMAFNRSMSAAGGIHPMTAAMSANALANARLKAGMHGPSLAAPMSAAAIAATARPSRVVKAKQIIAEQTSGLGAYAVPAGAGLAGAAAIGVPATAAVGAGAFAAKEAIAREAAMADIRKKVNLDPGQSFDDIEAIARRVSRERGMSFSDSAALIAQAGQSGVKTKDLGQFATLAAKVSSAWDISAKEAAQSIAEVGAQTGWSLQQLERFADRVNKAGDISAAAEKNISSMWQRASAGAKEAGLGYNDSMDALTALRSTGMQEEVAATFLGQFASRLRTATDQGKDAAAAFKDLGTSAAAVEKGMKTDAVGTMIDFLERLGKSKDAVKIALGVGGKQWWDEIMRLKSALPEWKRLHGELTDERVAGSLESSIKIDSSTTEASLSRLKQSALDLMGVMGKPAGAQWGGLFDGIAGGVDRAREALENYRRSAAKPIEVPKGAGRSVDEYARQLKIGDPTKANAEQINAALPFARHNLSRFDPDKIWLPTDRKKKKKGRRGQAPIPTFAGGAQRPESSVLESTPRPLPKNAPLPPRRPKMAPQTDHAPEIGGSVPAFASSSGVTPKVDTSQIDAVAPKADAAKAALEGLGVSVTPNVNAGPVEHLRSAAEGAKQAIDGLGVHVSPSVDSAPVEGLRTSADGAKVSLEGLNTTVSPHVDQSSLHSTLSTLQAINAEIAKANGGLAGVRANAASAGAAVASARAAASRLPTMAQTNRGSYSAAGDPAGK